ncbi:MAG TPA: hypothetical protein VKT81_13435 [Bryobacteraceae bacterium]|nr:hypothetical protein [Bryobacteraceae bacterium]
MSRALLGIALVGCIPAIAQQTTFDFHSNFWVNLHHFLYQQATSKTPEPCDSTAWQQALEVYRSDIAKHELLSREIAGINVALAHVESSESLKGSGIDAELTQTLERAASVYKERWWPQHNRQNLAWIQAVTPLVSKYEAAMKKELADAYQTPWPTEKIRTDVSAYASWAGAYTLNDPTLITISSQGPVTPSAVESLFHEASHAMIEKISNALSAELDAQKKLFKRSKFWHAVLFYTAGEVAQKHLVNYTMIGVTDGILERAWPGALPVLEKDWKPYLDGKIDLATAVRRLVEDYGVPK